MKVVERQPEEFGLDPVSGKGLRQRKPVLWRTQGGRGVTGRILARRAGAGCPGGQRVGLRVKEQELVLGCPWERKGEGMSYFKGKLEA